ncbi:hypothetical protein ASPBRDRAFT_287277 [Aspergillus brasiliensis CBS 101740]|uniref:Uncharacterized protein n=1 Tax=Aspergillus brasiliensis (strain CBS 101740 / IMI 381727 / IBT 21946) TaxID=767769 RepID=A0A1L9UB72_ASPBC|nr:hypothetical protein ASPBRDRAFT_287277 [Aspergillus brasiliensis CBS 101740]
MRVGLAFGSMFIDCRIGKFVWSPSGKLSVFASVYPYFTFLFPPHLSGCGLPDWGAIDCILLFLSVNCLIFGSFLEHKQSRSFIPQVHCTTIDRLYRPS